MTSDSSLPASYVEQPQSLGLTATLQHRNGRLPLVIFDKRLFGVVTFLKKHIFKELRLGSNPK